MRGWTTAAAPAAARDRSPAASTAKSPEGAPRRDLRTGRSGRVADPVADQLADDAPAAGLHLREHPLEVGRRAVVGVGHVAARTALQARTADQVAVTLQPDPGSLVQGFAIRGGTIGLLGESLEEARVGRGVVANADGADPLVPGEPIHREAALALAATSLAATAPTTPPSAVPKTPSLQAHPAGTHAPHAAAGRPGGAGCPTDVTADLPPSAPPLSVTSSPSRAAWKSSSVAPAPSGVGFVVAPPGWTGTTSPGRRHHTREPPWRKARSTATH